MINLDWTFECGLYIVKVIPAEECGENYVKIIPFLALHLLRNFTLHKYALDAFITYSPW